MEETFKESVIDKIRQIEKRLTAFSDEAGKADQIKKLQKILISETGEFKLTLAELNHNIERLASELTVAKGLSAKLESYSHQLEIPIEKKEYHIHHFRWPFFVAVAVFLALTLAVSALYVNHQKLKKYVANDTKYRSLKLMKDKGLHYYLRLTDSLYRNDPDMRKRVLQQETERKRRLELLQKAREKQQEAEMLRRKAVKNG